MSEPTYRIHVQPDEHGYAALIFNAADGDYRTCRVERSHEDALAAALAWIQVEARKDGETTTHYATEDGELCDAPDAA